MFKSVALLMIILVSAVVSAAAINATLGVAGTISTTGTSTSSTSSIIATSSSSTVSSTTQTSTVVSGQNGILTAQFSVGPTQPVCYVNATSGPPPTYFASVKAVVTGPSGQNTTYSIPWMSEGCDVTGTLSVSLAPGSYTVNLTQCGWMGCRSALPRDFTISAAETTYIDVSIFTGIV